MHEEAEDTPLAVRRFRRCGPFEQGGLRLVCQRVRDLHEEELRRGSRQEHAGGQASAATQQRVEKLANDMCSGATEENMRGIIELAKEHGVPVANLIGFIFDSLLNENAVMQITECAPLLKGLYEASPDKRSTQQAILSGVAGLVTSAAHGGALIKKTPAILMALYDLDLIEEAEVLKWHAQAPGEEGDAGKRAREAAASFIKWLREAEEESSAGEEKGEEAKK